MNDHLYDWVYKLIALLVACIGVYSFFVKGRKEIREDGAEDQKKHQDALALLAEKERGLQIAMSDMKAEILNAIHSYHLETSVSITKVQGDLEALRNRIDRMERRD